MSTKPGFLLLSLSFMVFLANAPLAGRAAAIQPEKAANPPYEEMVRIEEGCFLMGSEDGGINKPMEGSHNKEGDGTPAEGSHREDEGKTMTGSKKSSHGKKRQTVHEVCVDRFYMDKYEVTQEQYLKYIGHNPSKLKGPDRPVEMVTWHEAENYCRKAGKRLPTEAEWEYAARGNGNMGEYWYEDNSGGETQNVGGKSPNGYGLHDMLGNVWEWTADWYDKNYYKNSPRHNPRGPSSGKFKVLRGGSWSDTSKYLRPAKRFRFKPSHRENRYGFRCVR